MTAAAITSESATRPPTAVSGVMPVRWRSWSTNAMNAIGIATERISSVVRRIRRLFCPASLCCLAAAIAACALSGSLS